MGRNFFFCEIPKLCFYETCLSKKKVPTKGNNIQKPRLIVDCVAGASNKCFSCQSVKNVAFLHQFYSKIFFIQVKKTKKEATGKMTFTHL